MFRIWIATSRLLIGVLGATQPVPGSTTPSQTAPSSTPKSTSSLLVRREPQALVRVTLIPPSASATFSGPDMDTVAARSGTTAKLPIGTTQLTVTAPGFQRVTKQVTVASGTQGAISVRLDPVGQLHRHRWDARTGSNPKQVAFTPNGAELWVPLLGSRGVDVFRTTDGQKVTTIGLGNNLGAVEVIFNSAGTRAFVSQMQTASVFEIDVITKRVLRRFQTGGNWTKVLLLSPDESTLFAANWVSNDVSVIDVRSGKLLRKIATVKTPRGLSTDPTGARLFVAGFDGGEIQRVTLATPSTADVKKILFRTGGAMRHMAVDPATNRLYADDMGTSMTYVLNLATEEVKPLAPVDSHPNTIDLEPTGRYLYVSNRGANNPKGYNIPGPEWGSVLVIDTTTGAAVDAIVGGNQTTGLDVSDDGRYVAFTDFLDNRLALYEIPTASVLEEGQGGLAPVRRRLIVK